MKIELTTTSNKQRIFMGFRLLLYNMENFLLSVNKNLEKINGALTKSL